MAERVLILAAFLSPRLHLQAEALPRFQQWLNLLADSGEVTAMEFDAVYRQGHTASLTENRRMQKITGAFLHQWQGEEFRLWSHLSPLKCAEATGVVQTPMT